MTVALGCGCGGSSGLTITSPSCNGGRGPEIHGVVEMPHGRVAQAGSVQRVASWLWAEAAALTGEVSPVGAGVRVELVELRSEDLPDGPEPGPVEITATEKGGEFCIGLPEGTDENVCRFVLQVGTSADHTLTRAFVYSTGDPIDIDYRSEATVRVILAQIPPATLCDFSPDDIRGIYDAVVAAPGTATGSNADEVNAVAASIAAADPGVDAAISASYHRAPTATATQTVAPATATPTGPTPTRTPILRPSETATPRATRTPQSGTATPTHTSTRPSTRTPTSTTTPS